MARIPAPAIYSTIEMFWNFSVFLAIQLQLYHVEQILHLLVARGFYGLPIECHYVRFLTMHSS